MPHPEVSLERPLVGVEQIVVAGDAAPGAHLLERLEFRQGGLGQRLGLADEGEHLALPLLVQPLPVLVVVERPLLELRAAARDLPGIRHGVAADVHPAVDDAVVDAERRGQAMHAGIGRAERAVGSLRRHHVEAGHGLGEVHGVVEPEALVVVLAELHRIRIRRLRPLGARQHLQRTRQRKAPRLLPHTPTPGGTVANGRGCLVAGCESNAGRRRPRGPERSAMAPQRKRAARAAPGAPARRSTQPQRGHRIVLEDERMHLRFECRVLEVPDPAIGADQRKVRAEEHLVPEL